MHAAWRHRWCLAVVLLAQGAAGEDRLLTAFQSETLPNDTSGTIHQSFTDDPETGGRLLKVRFDEAGASFGQSRLREGDFSACEALRFDVWNPSREAVELTLTIRHAGSTNFASRVDATVTLKPGKNAVALPLRQLRNNDKSPPDWTAVRHWYFTAPAGRTLYFSDLRLTAAASSPRQSAPTAARKPLPRFDRPVLFNSTQADEILAGVQLFPPDSPWYEEVAGRPVHPRSADMIATVDPNRHLYFNLDMAFVMVPPDQPKVPVRIVDYPGESDPGPFPIPDNAPIEGWPVFEPDLQKIQRHGDGDRHLIVLDPWNRRLHEFFVARRTDTGWQAAQASTFRIDSNQLRPDGWTSADAAGLPILPGVVRYDDLQRGIVPHAMRVTVRRTRRAYVYPATHYASRDDNPLLLRMGERLRLRADFDESGFSPHALAVVRGLKKYGMLVADNGVSWCLSVAPDARIKGLDELVRIKGRDFEVIVPTGPNEGPRAGN